MPGDERARVTRRALIEAAARRLETSDESELRIADVCADTGYSSSVIYSNFRSRQGLVDAALLDLFDRTRAPTPTWSRSTPATRPASRRCSTSTPTR